MAALDHWQISSLKYQTGCSSNRLKILMSLRGYHHYLRRRPLLLADLASNVVQESEKLLRFSCAVRHFQRDLIFRLS
jgi:hypothetical protein